MGPSTDGKRTGIFCIGPATLDVFLPLHIGFMHARDRAKPFLCTEWRTFGAPSCWSMPVVIAFQVPRVRLCGCGPVGDARKWVIKGVPGDLVHFGPIRVLFDIAEYHAWRRLHTLLDLPANHNCLRTGLLFNPSHERVVMCGGKVTQSATDSFFWCRQFNSSPPSCGRVCAISDLRSLPNWTRWKKRHLAVYKVSHLATATWNHLNLNH